MKSAWILRIERISPNDGKGLRTVVFFKGCPLRCKWCAAPESQKMKPESCLRAGRAGIFGKEMTTAQVMKEIRKDEIFFYHSQGGVTLSGGDVLCQADFARELLMECKESEIHTMAELDMYGDFENVRKLLPWLDGFYADVKMMDSTLHKKWTGVGNESILENIKKAALICPPNTISIRVPLIWDINDGRENIQATARYCEELKSCRELEFLPYHSLGLSAYESLGREYELKHLPAMSFADAYEKVKLLKKMDLSFPVKISGKVI